MYDDAVFVSPHARARWFKRHGRAAGWAAVSSVDQLAIDAWNKGTYRWLSVYKRVVKDYKGCRFVFTPDSDPMRVLITFFPIMEGS